MPKEAKTTTKTVTDRKKRAKKDPNAPKRGLSAYMFFAQDHREQVKADNPNISFGQIGKVLGEQWKNMDEEDRKPYDEKAAKDKERYEAEKSAYTQ